MGATLTTVNKIKLLLRLWD